MAYILVNMSHQQEKSMKVYLGNVIGGAVMGLAVFTLVFGWVF